MPSKKQQGMIDKANTSVTDRLEQLTREVDFRGAHGRSAVLRNFDAASELELLGRTHRHATNLPDSVEDFCAAIGTTPEELSEIRHDYLIGQVQRGYDQLTTHEGIGDMFEYTLGNLHKNSEKLGDDNVLDTMKRINPDLSGQDFLPNVVKNAGFRQQQSFDTYVEQIGALFPDTDFKTPLDAKHSEILARENQYAASLD